MENLIDKSIAVGEFAFRSVLTLGMGYLFFKDLSFHPDKILTQNPNDTIRVILLVGIGLTMFTGRWFGRQKKNNQNEEI